MEDHVDIPAESMRHIEALLARHPPQMIQRMFSQTLESQPRSYPAGLDPTRPVPAILTPASDISSPHDNQFEHSITPTDDISIASPTLGQDEKGQGHSGEPYMFCTYCAEQKSLKTFKAKSDWKKHEMRMHETGEDWACVVLGCSRIFDRQKDFIKHHQRYHSGRPLPSLTDIGITLLPRRVFGCGFDKCKEVSIGWDERCDHVAKHMKNGATSQQWKYSNILIGHSNVQLSRTRLASLNAAMLGVTSHTPNYHCGSSPFGESNSPTVDTTESRISYMDLDPGDYLDVAQPPIPDLHLSMSAPQIHTPSTDNGQQMQTQPQQNNYLEQAKSSPNPLGWYYPNYFDAAPQFEESQYYDRPSLGQMITKPLNKIGHRLSTSRNSSRPTSHIEQSHGDMNVDFGLQNPVAALSMRNLNEHVQPQQPMQTQEHFHQQQTHQPQHAQQLIAHPQPQHFRNPAQMRDQLHLFTTHN
ncbi:hypothetical protein EJ07DRAFT_112182 [Lizonia empirigonia]|nr:hypothetical protein EJ07DRAFT_112182 [Lizonia empirigonia]